MNVFLAAAVFGSILTVGCNFAEVSSDETSETQNSAQDEPAETDTTESSSKNDDDEVASKVEKPVEPGKDEKDFIPAGWKQEDRVTGDLNGDSLPDTVLQIVKENSDTDYNRRMIVLLKTRDGKYTLGAEGKKVIRCTECNGTFGPGPADIKIAKGVIIVSQLYGSRSATDYLHRFRYEKGTGKFRLIGEDVQNFDRGTGESETTSTNYLNGKQIVTEEQVNESGDYVEVSRKEKSVARTKKYVQDVDYADY